MKKRISLLVALSVIASAFVSFATVTSAATAPEVVISATEVDFTDAAYSSYAGDYDWSEYNEDAVGEYKTYDVEVKLTGLELSTESYKSGKTTKYRGTSLISAAVAFAVSTEGDYENDWISGITSTLVTGATSQATASLLSVADSNPSAVYPAPNTVATVAATDETPAIFHALVTVDTGKPVTFTLTNADIVIGSFTNSTSDAMANSTTEYATEMGNFPVAGVSLTLPTASAPVTTTYTITFKTYDGASNVEEQTVDEGDTITPPTAPTRSGFSFAYWSEDVDGTEATIGTAAADKTYYAVYTADPIPDEIIAPVENKVDAQDIGTTALTDLQGKSVGEFKKNYGIAKFDTAITTGDKNYFVVATDDKAEEKQFAVDFAEIGVEAENANVSFFAIVKSATHKIVSVALKAVAK